MTTETRTVFSATGSESEKTNDQLGLKKIKESKTENGRIKQQNQSGPYVVDTQGKLPKEIGTDYSFKRKIVWFNAIGFLFLHFLALYGAFLFFTAAHPLTIVWTILVALASGEGITIGAHRMWSHKTFKALFLVRLGLIILQTVAGQNCLYVWARDHRLHHKYSDTDADPHNSNRGFFFSHMGWLMSRKHPAVISKGKTIDMTDLEADHLVMLQKKYYNPLYLIFAISIPVAVPVYLWDENYITSFFTAYMFRYILTLHVTWLVNSAAHLYGTRPFDKYMQPVESKLVAFLSIGEGWHNYHHVFPWDYRASEFGSRFNITTKVIDFMAYLGLIYDLRAAPESMIQHRALKAGDGTHPKYGYAAQPEKFLQVHPVEETTPAGDENSSTGEETIVDDKTKSASEGTTISDKEKSTCTKTASMSEEALSTSEEAKNSEETHHKNDYNVLPKNSLSEECNLINRNIKKAVQASN